MSTDFPACSDTCCQGSKFLGTLFTLRSKGLNVGGWHFKKMHRKAAQGTELLMVEHQAPV